MLSGHNGERASLGMPLLRWDDGLAQSAQRHAEKLAESGALRHEVATGPKATGENLWIGTHGAYRYRDMMDAFLRERPNYVPLAMPNISRTGRWSDAAHYSQIIWRTTTAVGCGFASGDAVDVLVCRYDPAGNIMGLRADEDLRPTDRNASHSAGRGVALALNGQGVLP